MVLRIYNTLTRKKETFKPINRDRVNIFVCGPTVYDFAHVGHAKNFVQFDVIVKYLRWRGYKVFYLENITDIDDKIIIRAKEKGIKPSELAKKFEIEFLKDMKSLGVDSVNKYARATDYIKEIEDQVKRLIEKGYAYEISDGYYFDLSKDPDYGKLARRKFEEAEDAVSRIDENKEKRNKGDFCLWKFYKEGEPYWESSLGKGRPGWHIEDTAITEKEFGPQYDLHGGAMDLIFPHHEAEIAQMESLSGKKPMAKYWIHIAFLTIDKIKMSKSLKNFVTIREALEKYNSKTLRFLFASSYHRTPINFSYKKLEQSRNALERLNEFSNRLKNSKEKDNLKLIEETRKKFIDAMDDDFDCSKAFQVIFDFVREVNKNGGGKKSYAFISEIDKIFNILTSYENSAPKQIRELAAEREKFREEKNFRKADGIRDKIKNLGYSIEDSEDGPVIKKLS